MTVSESPSANTTTAGTTSERYPGEVPMRSASSSPQAAISGPAVMKRRGPRRPESAPTRRERANRMIVAGSTESPLRNGE